MRVFSNKPGLAALAAVILATSAAAQPLSPEIKARVDVKLKEIQSWSTDPVLMAAERRPYRRRKDHEQ
jgi:hypothetical protein